MSIPSDSDFRVPSIKYAEISSNQFTGRIEIVKDVCDTKAKEALTKPITVIRKAEYDILEFVPEREAPLTSAEKTLEDKSGF